MDAFTELEHVPEKLPDFFDWNTPNSLESERLLFDRRIPSGGQVLKTIIASRGIAHGQDEASLTVFGTKTR
jgi:hypothetical protein